MTARTEPNVLARLEAVHERLAAAVAELSNGDAWRLMLQAASRFHQYSPHNVLLITSQCPEASAVAGFHTWTQLGRQVRKGEKGIAILAPVVRRTTTRDTRDTGGTCGPGSHDTSDTRAATSGPGGSDSEPRHDAASGDTGESSGTKRVSGFRVVHVFNLSQTDGPDLPTVPAPELLRGAAPAGLYDGLATQVHDQGFGLIRHDLDIPHLGEGRANGVTDYFARTVIVAAKLDDAQATKTLAHELGHVLLHDPTRRPDGLTRPRAEIEAESVAYIVTAAHGLDTDAYTVPYVTGWAGGDPQLLQQTAERVLTAAQQILTHTPPPPTFTLPHTGARTLDRTVYLRSDRSRRTGRTEVPEVHRTTEGPPRGLAEGLVSETLQPPGTDPHRTRAVAGQLADRPTDQGRLW